MSMWVWCRFPPLPPSLPQNGLYTNLREMQDDLLLMIKNAHYFNEPGSEIYKVKHMHLV